MTHIEQDIANRLLAFFHSPDEVEDWLTTKQFAVGLSPQQLIDIGMAEDVLHMVSDLERLRASRSASAH